MSISLPPPLPQPAAPAPGTPPQPDAQFDAQYQAFIGPGAAQYYGQRFAAMDQRRSAGQHWHWPAFFITFFWLLYRKMWLYSLLYLVASAVYGLVISLVVAGLESTGLAGEGMLASLSILLSILGLYVFPALVATPLYHRHCKQKIRKVHSYCTDPALQLDFLRKEGGTSIAPVIIFGVTLPTLTVIGILAAIAIPAYQDYALKAQVHTAYQLAMHSANEVGEFYHLYEHLPATIEEADPALSLPEAVHSIWLDPDNGNLHVSMGPAHKSGTFLLKPYLDDNEQVQWTCENMDLAYKYLPAACK